MGQRIWAVLEQYAGNWVAVDRKGEVVSFAATLAGLDRSRPGLTVLYAAA